MPQVPPHPAGRRIWRCGIAREEGSAAAAELAPGWRLATTSHQAAAHRRLVFQLPPEFDEAHVRNGAGQAAILQHAAHVQVFNADGMETTRQASRKLVRRV